jgi:signal transduction histidine kinase
MIKLPVKLNLVLAAASLLVVFVIDIITPTEFVADILYLCCIVLVFKNNTRVIIGFSAVACMLIITDLLFFEISLRLSLAHLVNRFMSIVAIVITSYIAILYRNLNQASMNKERQHLKALEEILFITSHRVRKPVANVLGLIDVITNKDGALPARDLSESYRYLRSSANELDNIIKELNTFIEQTEQLSNLNDVTRPKPALLAERHPVEYSKNGALMLVVN